MTQDAKVWYESQSCWIEITPFEQSPASKSESSNNPPADIQVLFEIVETGIKNHFPWE